MHIWLVGLLLWLPVVIYVQNKMNLIAASVALMQVTSEGLFWVGFATHNGEVPMAQPNTKELKAAFVHHNVSKCLCSTSLCCQCRNYQLD
jgi:hypothetical protein